MPRDFQCRRLQLGDRSGPGDFRWRSRRWLHFRGIPNMDAAPLAGQLASTNRRQVTSGQRRVAKIVFRIRFGGHLSAIGSGIGRTPWKRGACRRRQSGNDRAKRRGQWSAPATGTGATAETQRWAELVTRKDCRAGCFRVHSRLQSTGLPDAWRLRQPRTRLSCGQRQGRPFFYYHQDFRRW